MLEWEEFKNAKIDIAIVLQIIAAELRTNHQESFSTNDCQQMLKLFSSDEWRSYINTQRSIGAIVFSSSEILGRLIMRQILQGNDPKLPSISTDTKSKIHEALDVGEKELQEGSVAPTEHLAGMEKLLTTAVGKEKAKKAISFYSNPGNDMVYVAITHAFSIKELESMIKLNKHMKSAIVKDKNDVLGELTFSVISSMIENIQK